MALTRAAEIIKERLERAVAGGEAPSAVAVIGDHDTRHTVAALGVTRYGDEGVAVTTDTVFDLASLTKVISTLPAVLKLADAGEIDLNDRIGRFFSNAGWFQQPSLADATLRQLLTHSSGLPAWKPLFAHCSERRTAIANVLQTGLEHPPGTPVYSDLSFILLGAVVERVTGERQDAFVRQQVFEPLGMTRTGYGPVSGPRVAATEDCGWRGRVLQGEVHDENAFVLDGVAGHAGLFGVAEDLARYGQAWLNLDARLAAPQLLDSARKEQVSDETSGVRRGLGWQLGGINAGNRASEQAYGHTGFTGTSLWIDPGQGWFAVLLTNRVHPSRTCGKDIGRLRADVHDAMAGAFARA